jgi:hypothetical protein
MMELHNNRNALFFARQESDMADAVAGGRTTVRDGNAALNLAGQETERTTEWGTATRSASNPTLRSGSTAAGRAGSSTVATARRPEMTMATANAAEEAIENTVNATRQNDSSTLAVRRSRRERRPPRRADS